MHEMAFGGQAYNGILQSAPPIFFTLVAGPLSDRYGRKPLILISFFGQILLGVVFLVNTFWFEELKVEYLLFECLQDLTGGNELMVVGVHSYMTDITARGERTARMCLLDAWLYVGMMLGFQLGTAIKSGLGWVALSTVYIVLFLVNMLYVVFILKEPPRPRVDEETKQKEDEVGGWSCREVAQLPLAGLASLTRLRPGRDRTWLLCFLATMAVFKFAEAGGRVCNFMFYKRQYGGSLADYSNFTIYFTVLTVITQTVVVPVLSNKFKVRDTSIIILAMTGSILGYTVFAFGTDLRLLFLAYLAWSFYANIHSTSRSCLTKLVSPTEVGSVLSAVAVAQAVLTLLGKPFFGFLYGQTVSRLPATYLLLSILLYLAVLGVVVTAHCGMRRQQEGNEGTDSNREMK